MARLLRIDVVGMAQHLIQRGNNRQVCFVSEVEVVLPLRTIFQRCI